MSVPEGVHGVELFVVLVAIASAAALVTTRLAMPYSVALILAGLVVGAAIPPEALEVTPELILAVLVPGLVFEASFKLDVAELRKTSGLVAILAIPGVLITAAVVAVVASVATGLDPALGFLLGAMVSATDPVAVIDLFKRLDAPGRLATVVDAEALFNDGTGVVLFAIALVAITRPVGVADGAAGFGAVVIISAILGVLAGLVAVGLMSVTNDRLIQTAISVVAAYGTYLVALRFGQSGIVATVSAGIVVGWAGQRGRLPQRTMAALDGVWGFAAFMITALTFLLIGRVIGLDLIVRSVPLIVAGYVAITLARAFVVYVLIGGTERALPGPSLLPVSYLHVMFWAGLRGAIAIALVLALPQDIPERDLLTGAVYGIVLVTILFQGTTAGWVIRRAGAIGDRAPSHDVASTR